MVPNESRESMVMVILNGDGYIERSRECGADVSGWFERGRGRDYISTIIFIVAIVIRE
jgi:hypothetical protein